MTPSAGHAAEGANTGRYFQLIETDGREWSDRSLHRRGWHTDRAYAQERWFHAMQKIS